MRCQIGMPTRIRIYAQIFYQQYKLFVTICSQQKEKDSVFAVIFSILSHINVAALLCVLHKNYVKGGRWRVHVIVM